VLPIIEPFEALPNRQSTSSDDVVVPQRKKKKKKKDSDETETSKKRKRSSEFDTEKQPKHKKKKDKKKKKKDSEVSEKVSKKEKKKEHKKEKSHKEHIPSTHHGEKKPILIELPWKSAEDTALRKAGQLFGTGNWDIICDIVNSSLYPTATPRAPAQCRNRFIRLTHGASEEPIEQSLLDISNDSKRQNLEKAMQIWYAKKSASRKQHEEKNKKKPRPFAVASSVQNPIDYMYALRKLVESTPVVCILFSTTNCK
jgi:hypothetical protein